MVTLLKYQLRHRLWWRYMTGYELLLPWPYGWIYLSQYTVRESTPDDAYKPWFDEHVGRQGIDWEWFVHPRHSAYILNVPTDVNNAALIKIRKGKAAAATLAKLAWL